MESDSFLLILTKICFTCERTRGPSFDAISLLICFEMAVCRAEAGAAAPLHPVPSPECAQARWAELSPFLWSPAQAAQPDAVTSNSSSCH